MYHHHNVKVLIPVRIHLLIICFSVYPVDMLPYFFSYIRKYLSSQVLGGIEPSLYKGDIWYTPIKEEWYYQIEILKLEIGGQSLNLDCREVFSR